MAGPNHFQLVPIFYKQNTLSLLFPLGNLRSVPKCRLGVLFEPGCVSNPSVFIDFYHHGLLEPHIADSMNLLFCFGLNILISYPFLSKTFYLWVLEDTNEHLSLKCQSLCLTMMLRWQEQDRFVSFSVCKCQRFHRRLSIMELQSTFTVCWLTHLLRLCIFSYCRWALTFS